MRRRQRVSASAVVVARSYRFAMLAGTGLLLLAAYAGSSDETARGAQASSGGVKQAAWSALCGDRARARTDRVFVGSGTDLVRLVHQRGPATTFCIEAGVHRLTRPIVPKTDDVFVGQRGAVLSGAKAIGARFRPSGRAWVANGQTQQNPAVVGRCASGSACRYADDVFLDDRPLRRVLSRSELEPGAFFFDYERDEIWLAQEPRRHRVDAAVATRAFQGWGSGASRVRVSGLVIEKFANEAQIGAINARADWVVDDSEVRLNHGVGIQGARRIAGNHVHHNGQLGIGGDGLTAAVVRDNEIDHNNYAGFDGGWEAGGAKWLNTSRLTVRGNVVRDNAGHGLWTDTDNVRTTYVDNRVIGNSLAGIFHETSYDAVIANNVVIRNGLRATGWVNGAGILVNSSPNVVVRDNRVADNGDGIGLVQSDRGGGRYGRHELHDVSVHGNMIVMRSGHTGLVHDSGGASLYTSSRIRFERNSYVLGCNATPFAWASSPGSPRYAYVGKDVWLAAGNDRAGRFDSRCDRGGGG
jgi:hypothetical protein